MYLGVSHLTALQGTLAQERLIEIYFHRILHQNCILKNRRKNATKISGGTGKF
jgi:hypothetical protein